MIINAIIERTYLNSENSYIILNFIINDTVGRAKIPCFPIDKKIINAICDIAGVECWEELVGKAIRFEIDVNEKNYIPKRIGHIILDNWIDIQNEDVNLKDGE